MQADHDQQNGTSHPKQRTQILQRPRVFIKPFWPKEDLKIARKVQYNEAEQNRTTSGHGRLLAIGCIPEANSPGASESERGCTHSL